MSHEVKVLDSVHTLDARRHALVVKTDAGEVLFHFYEDTGVTAQVESLTIRGVEYQATGRHYPHGFAVYDMKRCDWIRSARRPTDTAQRAITAIVRDALQSAQIRGHILLLERATRRWNAQSRLESLASEREELQARLAQLEVEVATNARVLAEVTL